MGRINLQPENESMINHFSHPHPLNLSNSQPHQTLNLAPCSGCKLQLSGSIYSCTSCSYHLHLKCSQAPHQITHPFHKNHILTLLPTPSYSNGFFNCDACGKQGNGFSYQCKACEIDLHSTCASMPLLLTHPSHGHQLTLVFSPPYSNKSFSCDICKNIGGNHWLYRCNLCGFDAHLGCTQTQVQNQHTMSPAGRTQTSPPVVGIPTGPVPGLENYANQIGERSVQDQYMVMIQMLQNMRNSGLPFQQALLGGGVGTAAGGGNPFQHTLLGGGSGRNNMINTMMGGGGGGNQLLQGLMGGGGNPLLQGLIGGRGGGNDFGSLMQGLMGGGGGSGSGANNIMQLLGGGGGDLGSLMQGLMGGTGGLDLLGGASGGLDLSGLAGALGGFGGFGM